MSPDRRAGVFVAVVGPSGAGKDTLMTRAARHHELRPAVRFIRRTVTRPALSGAEDHDSLEATAFAEASATGAFSLTWTAHGLSYGLPRAVHDDLGEGRIAVANLSRHVLAEALLAFGSIRVVEITARPEVLEQRLLGRGREDLATVRERLRRQVALQLPEGDVGHQRIDNSGDIGTATDRLVAYLNGL